MGRDLINYKVGKIMIKKFLKLNLPVMALVLILIFIWGAVSESGAIPQFILPSPGAIFTALINILPVLLQHSVTTLSETALGLIFSVTLAIILAILMDRFVTIKRAIYPVLVVTQTVPTIAIAPFIVLLFGYDMLPKVILVVICCFFPIAISLCDGFSNVEVEYLNLMHCMNATYAQTLVHLKIPFAVPSFFSGLKVSATYAFISAVVAEWLGGTRGLGVYMTRVKAAYAFDRLFASIFFISVVSFVFVKVIELAQKKILNRLHLGSERGSN